MVSEIGIAVELKYAVVVAIGLPILVVIVGRFPLLLKTHHRLQQILTDHILVLYLHFDFVYWGNLDSRNNPLFRFFHLLSQLAQLERSLADRFSHVWFVLGREDAFGVVLKFFARWSNILSFPKSNIEILLDKGVKSVLYFVLRPSWKILADFWPFASHFAIQLKNFLILLLRPIFLFDSGI